MDRRPALVAEERAVAWPGPLERYAGRVTVRTAGDQDPFVYQVSPQQ
jgi:hypothetical protein